jgi:hypothetical protein
MSLKISEAFAEDLIRRFGVSYDPETKTHTVILPPPPSQWRDIDE